MGFASASYLTTPVATSPHPTCFLFDNGSLRPASTLSLRRLAARLALALNVEVHPVSLLHSSALGPAELEGKPAHLLEPALLEFARGGGREAVLLPLFFGPSGALTDYLPARLASLRRHAPGMRIRRARWLVVPDDSSEGDVAGMLADAVRDVRRTHALASPKVLLTDHGSPQRAVTAVRDALGARLRKELADEVARVGVASMERRPGAAYAFNEPLLKEALQAGPFASGDVIVALQFLQPGRHAGPGGDIATLCAEATRASPSLRTFLTEPLGADPRLIGLLARRYQAALKSDASAR